MDNKAISSLNNKLPQFFLEELEQRLETDPLSVGGLYDLQDSGDSDFCQDYSSCNQDGACHDKITCVTYY